MTRTDRVRTDLMVVFQQQKEKKFLVLSHQIKLLRNISFVLGKTGCSDHTSETRTSQVLSNVFFSLSSLVGTLKYVVPQENHNIITDMQTFISGLVGLDLIQSRLLGASE